MDEAAQKLHGRQRHRAPLIALGVVLPVKRDVVAIEGEPSMIADRDPMGVAAENLSSSLCSQTAALSLNRR